MAVLADDRGGAVSASASCTWRPSAIACARSLMRLAFNTGLVAAFALGSVGAFLAFDWPPLLREIVLGYLLAFLALRLALVIGRFAPGARRQVRPRHRALPHHPDEHEAARFWHRRLGLLVGWFAFGWVTAGSAQRSGVLARRPPPRRLRARPGPARRSGSRWSGAGRALRPATVQPTPRRRRSAAARATCCSRPTFVVLWVLWVAGRHAGLLARRRWRSALPAAIGVTQRSVNHILRPPGVPMPIPGRRACSPSSSSAACAPR